MKYKQVITFHRFGWVRTGKVKTHRVEMHNLFITALFESLFDKCAYDQNKSNLMQSKRLLLKNANCLSEASGPWCYQEYIYTSRYCFLFCCCNKTCNIFSEMDTQKCMSMVARRDLSTHRDITTRLSKPCMSRISAVPPIPKNLCHFGKQNNYLPHSNY